MNGQGDAVREQLATTAENVRLRDRIEAALGYLSEWEGPLTKADGHKFGQAVVQLSLALHEAGAV